MKKILIIIGALTVGGGENMVCELTKNIDPKLYDVSVLCYGCKTMSVVEKKTEEHATVIYKNENGKIGIRSFINVFKAISSLNPDIIHAHLGGMVYAIPWAFFHPKKALLITAHTRPDKAFNKKVEWMLRLLLKYRKNNTRVVAVSEENHKNLMNYFSVDDSVCRFVNNGIDINKYYSKAHKEFTLINVARHDENKNQAALIRCFSRLHHKYANTKLLLLGDGDTHAALINQVDDLGLTDSVVFTGNVANAEDYYAISDLYVQTSHREAMPLSVLEAMAAGLPIVSTNVGGLCDVVKGNGYLVEDNDEEALLNAILCVFEQSAEDKKIMREESLRIVNEFSSEKMARLYEEIYEEIS